jgi:Salmonella virulence plasmid 65kDa B protein
VFSYLIASTFDSKGNATVYEYAAGDGAGVDPTVPHEANRVAADRTAQRYPKHIRFGNVQPYFPTWPGQGALTPLPADWHSSIVFDYGDHAPDAPTPAPDRPWAMRPDPFSAYRAGFEIRTYRRCARILLFHDFPNEQNVGADCLVRSTDLTYSDQLNPADPRNLIAVRCRLPGLIAVLPAHLGRRAHGRPLVRRERLRTCRHLSGCFSTAASDSRASSCASAFASSREAPTQPIADGFAHDQPKIAAL